MGGNNQTVANKPSSVRLSSETSSAATRRDVHGIGRSGSSGGGGMRGSGSGSFAGDDGSGSDRQRSRAISPSGIRAVLKGFSLVPWQFRESWDRDPVVAPRNKGMRSTPILRSASGLDGKAGAASGAGEKEDVRRRGSSGLDGKAGATSGAGAKENAQRRGSAPASPTTAAAASAAPAGNVNRNEAGHNEEEKALGGCDEPSSPPSGSVGSWWGPELGRPRIGRSHSMTVVDDIEKGKRLFLTGHQEGRVWPTSMALFAKGGVRARNRAASYDHAAMLEAQGAAEEAGHGRGGASWRAMSFYHGGAGRWQVSRR